MLKKLGKGIGVLAGGLFAFVLVFYVAILPQLESINVAPGSISAHLLVSSTIKSFPVVEPLGETGFTYASRTDRKPRTTALSYRSNADTEKLVAAAARYLGALGFKEIAPSDDALNYAKDDVRISFKVDASNDEWRMVTVSEFQGQGSDPNAPPAGEKNAATR